MGHTRGAPYHPQTQGKIERYHRTMKNVVKLQHYQFPEELKAALKDFVTYYNNERYHGVTPQRDDRRCLLRKAVCRSE
jgi:putative transposase